MASEEILRKTLKNADGKPFAKYKGLENNFVMDDFELIITDVQNDRTGHTAMRVRVPLKNSGFPEDTHNTECRDIALRDLIARRFWESARTHARSPIPKTSGGELFIPRPGQEILERGSVVITQFYIEVRLTADLPSDGNKCSAAAMELLIFGRIRTIVSESLFFSAYKQSKVYNHIFTFENSEFIRDNLAKRGLSAFVADGAVLPRRDDDLAPMSDAIVFGCDETLSVTFEVPNGEPVSGMGIRKGFTVITGYSGSGKTVLADALLAGVYGHIPGDGREYVVTDPTASYIMSEPGRPSDSVDISMFIIPSDSAGDTSCVKKERVSAPVSELVSVSEAVEVGSKVILIDEGFSNPCVLRRGFMSADDPLTPLSELAGSMSESGISVIAVSGDESVIKSADSVIVMSGFRASQASPERSGKNVSFRCPVQRCPVSKGMVFEKGRREVSITATSIRAVEIGEFRVDVPVAALFDISQTRTVADAAVIMKDIMDGTKTMADACALAIDMLAQADESAQDASAMYHVRIRPAELAAVMNRHPQMLAIQRRADL